MQINDQTQAVLLLTAWLGRSDAGQPQPLTTGEWARFAAWLRDQERTPADLLTNGHALKGWEDPKLPGERIRRLLERSAALAISVERWQRAGLWILSRSDPGYPSRVRKRLKANAPPILYGAGSMELLEAGGVAIIGARDAGDENLSFTSGSAPKWPHRPATSYPVAPAAWTKPPCWVRCRWRAPPLVSWLKTCCGPAAPDAGAGTWPTAIWP